MARKLREECDKAGLEINFQETEYLIASEDRVTNLQIDDNLEITGTNKFKYLGFIISNKGTTEAKIQSMLGQTRTCIKILNSVLWEINTLPQPQRPAFIK